MLEEHGSILSRKERKKKEHGVGNGRIGVHWQSYDFAAVGGGTPGTDERSREDAILATAESLQRLGLLKTERCLRTSAQSGKVAPDWAHDRSSVLLPPRLEEWGPNNSIPYLAIT